LQPAVDIIRRVNSNDAKFLYCSLHNFYFDDDARAMLRECADVLAHGRVGDTFNHKASSGLRCIPDPLGANARVHRRLNIGHGEAPSEDFFATLVEIGFDDVMRACVFAWEEKADESGRLMRTEMQRDGDKYWSAK
jgi:myo-inositol catabolism protein IolH